MDFVILKATHRFSIMSSSDGNIFSLYFIKQLFNQLTIITSWCRLVLWYLMRIFSSHFHWLALDSKKEKPDNFYLFLYWFVCLIDVSREIVAIKFLFDEKKRIFLAEYLFTEKKIPNLFLVFFLLFLNVISKEFHKCTRNAN